MRAAWIAAFAVAIASMPGTGVAFDADRLPHVTSIVRVAPANPTDGSAPGLTWQVLRPDGRDDDLVWRDGPGSPSASRREPDHILAYQLCGLSSRAETGQVAPKTGGGRFVIGYGISTTINSSGRVAFMANVSGSQRNQGIFVSDSTGVGAIVIGCGDGGGGVAPGSCGDLSPIGGTFSGLFTGTQYTPAINDAGDVLFLADINGGSSPRGLFLHRGASGNITKVAAVGDPSPLGGVFGAIGPGSLNNNGIVVFLAAPAGASDVTRADAYRWDNGVVTKIAAVGDPAPGGGFFSRIGDEAFGYYDGTYIPSGPVPDINDLNQICFNAWEESRIGVIIRTGSVNQWSVRAFDRTPAGGIFAGMWAPSINDHGEIAFYAYFYPTPSTNSAGWFAGRLGQWRKIIVFDDTIDGGQCHGLAVSRNPMQPIDEDGNVLFWAALGPFENQMGRVVVGSRNGDRLVVARDGDPAPVGETYRRLNPWPSAGNGQGTVNASLNGIPAGVLLAFDYCTTVAVSLQSYGSRAAPRGVEVFWQLAGIESGLGFEVYRHDRTAGATAQVEVPVIHRSGLDFVFEDNSTEPGKAYRYRVIVLEDGEAVTSFDTEIATPRANFALHSNVPNPFNPTTRIDFELDRNTRVALAIHDVGGRQVKTLLQALLPPGPHSVTWDGRDDSGRASASGIYVVRLSADGRTLRRKAVLLK